MKEYRVEVRVKNNLIYSKIEAMGYVSLREFCNKTDITYSTLMNIINMKLSPLMSCGNFRSIVHDLCKALKCLPEELFTQTQIETELETNKFTTQVAEAEMRFMITNQSPIKSLEQITTESRLPEKVKELMETLTIREAKVIRLRFGIEGNDSHTLEETARICDVTRERIRQIEAKALRKLRHPTRSEHLRDYFDEA